MLIWGAVQFTAVAAFVPETYHPVLLRRKARRLRHETGDDCLKAPIETMDRSIVQASSSRKTSCSRVLQYI